MCALRIVADDGCEVPANLVQQYGIKTVPLVVRFGDEVHDDGRLTIDEFWTKARTIAHPQTSQPSSGTFQEAFREIVEAGDDVLCVTITGKHSGTFDSAWLGAQQFPGKVTVYDSLAVSWGSGFLTLKAAQMAAAGEAVADIVARLDVLRSNMQFPILLNTIEYIRRGGRADQLIPLIERVLRVFSIKPILTFVDGYLKILCTARSYERGMDRMLELMAPHAPYQELALVHTRQPELAVTFANRLAAYVGYPREKLFVTEVGAVLATHAGPQAFAIIGVPAGI